MEDSMVNMLFAADLVGYILKHKNLEWESTNQIQDFRGELKESPFKNEIGLAIVLIIESNSSQIEQCYKNLQDDKIQYKEEFGRCALEAAHLYFEDGYSPGSFLGYCAMIVGVTALFNCYPSNRIPDCASEILALVLTSHQLTGEFNKHGGWNGLFNISKAFCEVSKEKDSS
ncbi:uncharacterized protein NPIL_344741 [Nephila pilipes]|uniref:Uncharacterized protein n=1 Tax=Nephila pilipes TaxID=299642 RepID=A0A8X6MSR0_NEPPI|nr:uncharacterized protein NPIL_344741 [Nephila pilipes]